MPEHTIRPFATPADFQACVRLQDEVWGPGFSERVPVAILKGAQRVGGVSAGAFSCGDGRLLGFVFGLTGVEDGEPAHWSDMLAVRPEMREAGLGVALKRYQRRVLLEAGVRTVRWTFDPLMAKNAHLNIRKLGAVVREYVPDMYGETGSPLHRGIGTDRMVALWKLDAPRVVERMAEGAGRRATDRPVKGQGGPEQNAHSTSSTLRSKPVDPPPLVICMRAADDAAAGHPLPSPPELDRTEDRLLVPVPVDIQALKHVDPELAASWRTSTRAALVHYLGTGYVVEDFQRGETHSFYLLVRQGDGDVPAEDR